MDDLTTGIVAFKQATVASQIQYAVAKKVLDADQAQGNAALKLVQAATQGFNQAGDQLVAAATGLGGQVDAYA